MHRNNESKVPWPHLNYMIHNDRDAARSIRQVSSISLRYSSTERSSACGTLRTGIGFHNNFFMICASTCGTSPNREMILSTVAKTVMIMSAAEALVVMIPDSSIWASTRNNAFSFRIWKSDQMVGLYYSYLFVLIGDGCWVFYRHNRFSMLLQKFQKLLKRRHNDFSQTALSITGLANSVTCSASKTEAVASSHVVCSRNKRSTGSPSGWTSPCVHLEMSREQCSELLSATCKSLWKK